MLMRMISLKIVEKGTYMSIYWLLLRRLSSYICGII
jgi:hypothetical protein